MTGATLSRRSGREFRDFCGCLVARGHIVRFRAEGWSMYPTIHDGEMVEVVLVNAAKIRRGDVLLCRMGSGFVAHRVMRFTRTARAVSALVLRGDAAFASDPPIASADVLGKAIATTRDGVRRRLDTPTARVLGSLIARMWRLKRGVATLPSSIRNRQFFRASMIQTSARSSQALP
jgi:hypothetical protein